MRLILYNHFVLSGLFGITCRFSSSICWYLVTFVIRSISSSATLLPTYALRGLMARCNLRVRTGISVRGWEAGGCRSGGGGRIRGGYLPSSLSALLLLVSPSGPSPRILIKAEHRPEWRRGAAASSFGDD
ncbi:hypothetical protein LINPERHAP2_LOCUS8232 [Linum perenne]